ncbi:hypothetical protein P9112_014499 [Eukaryota sp. TZLM1-RC]
MDDISCIGPESTINRVANEAATLYQSIGLELNVQKCFCISRKNVKLIINSKQKREFELKSAQQILKCSVPAVAVVKGAENNVSDDQQLNASSVPSSSPSENSNFCCPFCKKDVADSRNGRKLLFCTNCKAVDSVRPPIRIPVEISPASTIPFSMEMRNFTSE